MFSKLLRVVGKVLGQMADVIDPEIIILKNEVKVEPVLCLAYYCIPAQKNCDWFGKRCARCLHGARRNSHAVVVA
jgi:hypothetical protein